MPLRVFDGLIPSQDEELVAIVALKNDPSDERAFRVLAPTCRAKAVSMVRRYGFALHKSEIVQLCCMAVSKAVSKYDLESPTRFYTYAHWWIESYVIIEVHGVLPFLEVQRFGEELLEAFLNDHAGAFEGFKRFGSVHSCKPLQRDEAEQLGVVGLGVLQFREHLHVPLGRCLVTAKFCVFEELDSVVNLLFNLGQVHLDLLHCQTFVEGDVRHVDALAIEASRLVDAAGEHAFG
jgi:hypothetical protein